MKQVLFLYNPQSGKGKIEKDSQAIGEMFRQAGYSIVDGPIDFSRNPFNGHETVDLVVVAGGDGTVNYVVNRMKEKHLDLLLGIIPAGTANDFAGALGMEKNPVKAAAQLLGGTEERVDCGRVNDHYFVNIFSFGIFTTTSQRTPDKRKHQIGKLAYLIEGVKEFRSVHGIPLQILADGKAFDLESLMALIFNGETAGGFHLAPRSSIKDGMFDCLLLQRRNMLFSVVSMLRHLLGGRPSQVKHFRARTLDITSPINEPTDVDGQKGADFPLHIECLHNELRVVCPLSEAPPGPVRLFQESDQQTGMVADEITLQKVSISRIKQEMRDVYYLSDDLVIASFDIHRDTLGNYPALIDGFSAIIMASGSAVVAIDTEEYEVVPDTIVFFSPDRVIRTVASTSDAAAYFVACSKSFINEIQIDLSASLPVYMRFGKQPCLRVTPQDTHEIRQVFQLIKTILASDKEHYRQEIIRCLFTAVFYIITELNMREQKNTVKLGRGEVIFEEFMELVRQYSKQERNVRFYARRLNITPKYLSTVSKDVSGKTAARWIDEAVILEAKSLLRYSGMSIQEIAYHLNFSTQSFFGKYFKQHTGYSPSRFKRKGS